jgi:hypothetical protein
VELSWVAERVGFVPICCDGERGCSSGGGVVGRGEEGCGGAGEGKGGGDRGAVQERPEHDRGGHERGDRQRDAPGGRCGTVCDIAGGPGGGPRSNVADEPGGVAHQVGRHGARLGRSHQR